MTSAHSGTSDLCPDCLLIIYIQTLKTWQITIVIYMICINTTCKGCRSKCVLIDFIGKGNFLTGHNV